MTVLQKKPGNQVAHLTREDVEQIGAELDAIRVVEAVSSRREEQR